MKTELLAKALAWLHEHGLTDDAITVFASGSMVRGWSHAESDLDLYIVLPGQAPDSIAIRFFDQFPDLTEAKIPVAVDWIDGVKIDAEIWNVDQIDELLAYFHREGSDTNWELLVPDKYLDTLYRFSIALPLSGADWLEGLKSRIDAGEIGRVAARRALDEADAYLEDAVGFIASDRGELAALAARIGYGRVIDAQVSLGGEFQPNPKWRPMRVQATIPERFDEYWQIESMGALSGEDPKAWAAATVRKARLLTSNIVM